MTNSREQELNLPELKFWKIVPWWEALLWLQENQEKTIVIGGDSEREYDWTDFEYSLEFALNRSNLIWFIPKGDGEKNVD